MTLRAHAEHDVAHARLVGLLRDREQRFLERQRGFDQRRELARDQRQVRGAQSALEREREPARADTRASGLLLA